MEQNNGSCDVHHHRYHQVIFKIQGIRAALVWVMTDGHSVPAQLYEASLDEVSQG